MSWQTDAAGNVRLGRSLDGKIQDYQVRTEIDGAWHTVQSFEINKGRIFRPIAFVEDHPDRLYVFSNHEGGSVNLYEFDVLSNSFIRAVMPGAHEAVLGFVKYGRLIGYSVSETSSPVYLDADYVREAKVINRALPDSNNRIINISTDGKRVLVYVALGNEPPAYWLLDRTSGKPTLSPVAETYPKLEPEQIALTQRVSYKARDGREIPAFVTLPIGYQLKKDKPISFVVLPHGEQTSHDVSSFDYQVQFLASRGYGVLQPQFRGSSGYGAAFETAGYQQWGLAMQDDVTDGTRWLVEQKYADPARIALVGTGYGGYAALMGAVKEPSLYRCAVAIAPVTDLPLLIERLHEFYFGDLNIPRIGTDSEVLEKTSPARNTDRIRIPLLLVHGRKDYTVPVAHTERMEEALRKAGKPVEVLYLDNADHYLSRGDDRLAALRALD